VERGSVDCLAVNSCPRTFDDLHAEANVSRLGPDDREHGQLGFQTHDPRGLLRNAPHDWCFLRVEPDLDVAKMAP
jgi:hypothetical protein